MPTHSGAAIGIDLGIKTLATCSDGMVFENQKHYRQGLGRIKGLSKGLSRKVEGSQNWRKNTRYSVSYSTRLSSMAGPCNW